MPLDLLDTLHGHYSALLLLRLERLGILSELVTPRTAKELAKIAGEREGALESSLEYLAATTDFIARTRGARFKLAKIHPIELRFQLLKFVAAYGSAVANIVPRLEEPAGLVDGNALAAAFQAAAAFSTPIIPELVLRRGVRTLLDVGCGAGSLLIDIARRDPEFRGVGVDASAQMCRSAVRAAREAGLASRIGIHHAGGLDPWSAVPRSERRGVDAVHGRSFLNEFFGNGPTGAIRVLKRLRRAFPGRPAWFVDYYGALGHTRTAGRHNRLALLQDVAQVASGQGVPPPDDREWRTIYEQAGCGLERSRRFLGPGIRWFVHEVRLGKPIC